MLNNLKIRNMKRTASIIIMFALIVGSTNAFPQDENYFRQYFNDCISELDPIEGIYSVSQQMIIQWDGYEVDRTNDVNSIVIYKTKMKKGYTTYCSSCNDCSLCKGITTYCLSCKGISPIETTIERVGETNVYTLTIEYDDTGDKQRLRLFLESLFHFSFDYSLPPKVIEHEFPNDPITKHLSVRMEREYIKEYPTKAMYDNALAKREPSNWSGSGFALGNGYLVTNYHVVEDAKTINVKGIRGDFNNGYSAEVVATDKVNDIAILRINDSRFSGFGTIPYGVSSKMADVGESIFVLGYPLTQTMGDEIKLTDGLISSRTGFQGDIANYQMSAPVQPGNSGGPMFDSKGNVIGIVCAHHAGAENAGYAIKISYLKLLIESADLKITLPSNNTVSTLSLPEKVKRVKNFVFFIECSR